MKIVGILLCAGRSERMGFNKLTRPFDGKTAMERSMEALIEGGVEEIVCTVNDLTRAHALEIRAHAGVPVKIVEGGATRGESVFRALWETKADIVAIHDAARCFVAPSLVRDCIDSAAKYQSGVAAIPMTDTVLLCENGSVSPLPREKLMRTQTPQAFAYPLIFAAYVDAAKKGITATDDATLFAGAGYPVHFVIGSPDNRKLTTPADFPSTANAAAREKSPTSEDFPSTAKVGRSDIPPYRIGHGEDMHRLVPDRKLILGGVDIPFELGLLGHSDADVAVHALMDALLGAAALGDIGQQFPDNDEQYRGISSLTLLSRTAKVIADAGFALVNADIVIAAQKPKLAPYIQKMRENIARVLSVDPSEVSVKATTTEGLGPEGRMEGIRASATAMLYRI